MDRIVEDEIKFKPRQWVTLSIILSIVLHLAVAAVLPIDALRSVEVFGEKMTRVFRLMKIERVTQAELTRETTHEAVAVSPEEVEVAFRDLLWTPSMSDAFEKALAERPEPVTPAGDKPLDEVFAESKLPLLAEGGGGSGAADSLADAVNAAGPAPPDTEDFSPPARRTVADTEQAPESPDTTDFLDTAPVPEAAPPKMDAPLLDTSQPDIFDAVPELGAVAPPSLPVVSEPDVVLPDIAAEAPEFEMPVVEPPAPPSPGEIVVQPPDEGTTGRQDPSEEPEVTIDETPDARDVELAVDFQTCRQPGGSDRFFRLKISPAVRKALEPLGQDHLFVCDVSFSIKLDEIAETRAAIGRIINSLPDKDRFNVITFSEDISPVFADFQPATPEKAREAMSFIRRHPGQIKTDVCLAVREIAKRIREVTRPVALYLISDGSSTKGVRDARRIITEVSSVIGDNVSVFTFNAGEEANEYLLQLMSHINRGQMVSVPDIRGSGAKFVELVNNYRTPLLTSLQAAYGNLKVEDVYPARIPNLYQDRPIVLYGRCPVEGDAAIRIVANGVSERKTFFADFKIDPEQQGDPAIAKGWARGRINYLVSRIAREGSRPEWTNEIKRLGRQYDVHTPYD